MTGKLQPAIESRWTLPQVLDYLHHGAPGAATYPKFTAPNPRPISAAVGTTPEYATPLTIRTSQPPRRLSLGVVAVILAVIVVAAGGYFGYRHLHSSSAAAVDSSSRPTEQPSQSPASSPSPSSSAGSPSATPSTKSSSTAPTPNPGPSQSQSPAQNPSPTTAMTDFITSYYTLVRTNPTTAWNDITANLQAVSGSLDGCTNIGNRTSVR